MTENKDTVPSPLFEHPPLEEKPPFDIKKSDIIFLLATVLASVFTVFFGIFGGFSTGFFISLWSITAITYLYIRRKQHINLYAILCLLGALSTSVCFITTSNISVRFFAFCATVLAIFVFLYSVTQKIKSIGDIAFFGNILYTTCSTLSNIGVSIKSITNALDNKKRSFTKAFTGIACAVPLLIIIIPLLISSDVAFQGLIESIFSNTIQSIMKIILGLVLSLLIIAYGFSFKKDRTKKLYAREYTGIDNTYIISFLSVITLCYILYIFSQFAYFFSAMSGILPDGYVFTVAQYARRGFFEMATVAAINMIIVFASITISKKQEGKVNVFVKILCTFIILFTLLIIATAISKMVLYIDQFGMTVLRITTSSFMVFLSVVFISLLLRVYKASIKVLKVSLIAACCVLTVLGVANVNRVAAGYNYQRYIDKTLPDIDINAIYELGDEGVPYLTRLAKSKDKNVSTTAKNYLYECYHGEYFKSNLPHDSISAEKLRNYQKHTGFKALSLPKIQAYKALYEYWEYNKSFCYYIPPAQNSDDLELGIW